MTRLTDGGKLRGSMVGVNCRLIIRLVASIANHWSILETRTLVAERTTRRQVSSCQRELGQCVVKARPPLKCVSFVALGTVSRKACSCVVRIRRLFVIDTMAPNARDRLAGILIERPGCMTILAIERSMPSEERKPCQLVTLNHVSDLP